MAKKPVLLCIMDGFGWVPNETYGNAVALYPSVQKALDKLAKTNVIHKNKAANLKSSLAKHINKLA